jgi:hypothetical protein
MEMIFNDDQETTSPALLAIAWTKRARCVSPREPSGSSRAGEDKRKKKRRGKSRLYLGLLLSRRRERNRCLMDSKNLQILGSPDLMQRMMKRTTTRMAERGSVETSPRKKREKKEENRKETNGRARQNRLCVMGWAWAVLGVRPAGSGRVWLATASHSFS